MARHEIAVGFPKHEVRNVDVEIKVRSDDRILGRLLISKGSVDWRPRGKRSQATMSWEKFASLMERWAEGELR
jgi:hypothetical protein